MGILFKSTQRRALHKAAVGVFGCRLGKIAVEVIFQCPSPIINFSFLVSFLFFFFFISSHLIGSICSLL